MNSYINDLEFSTKQLISLIYNEEKIVNGLSDQIPSLETHFQFLREEFSAAGVTEDIDDIQLQGKFIRMAKKKAELVAARNEIARLKDLIDNKKHSIDALSMSLLQIAKQGISQVHGKPKEHGKPKGCPEGRRLGNET